MFYKQPHIYLLEHFSFDIFTIFELDLYLDNISYEYFVRKRILAICLNIKIYYDHKFVPICLDLMIDDSSFCLEPKIILQMHSNFKIHDKQNFSNIWRISLLSLTVECHQNSNNQPMLTKQYTSAIFCKVPPGTSYKSMKHIFLSCFGWLKIHLSPTLLCSTSTVKNGIWWIPYKWLCSLHQIAHKYTD